MNSESLIAILLLAGHLLADFFVQTRTTAEGKRSAGRLLRHGGEVLSVQVLVLWPFWCSALILPLLAMALMHLIIDAVKARATVNLRAFLLDQSAHMIVLAGAWWWLERLGVSIWTEAGFINEWTAVVLMCGLAAFTVSGGRTLVRMVLDGTGGIEQNDEVTELGARIGVLERLLIFTMVAFWQWAAVGFVMAAKTVARYSELDRKPFAEYFLIGTLTSVLIAALTGVLAHVFWNLLIQTS